MSWHVANHPSIGYVERIICLNDFLISIDLDLESSSRQNGVQITNVNVKTLWRVVRRIPCQIRKFFRKM